MNTYYTGDVCRVWNNENRSLIFKYSRGFFQEAKKYVPFVDT